MHLHARAHAQLEAAIGGATDEDVLATLVSVVMLLGPVEKARAQKVDAAALSPAELAAVSRTARVLRKELPKRKWVPSDVRRLLLNDDHNDAHALRSALARIMKNPSELGQRVTQQVFDNAVQKLGSAEEGFLDSPAALLAVLDAITTFSPSFRILEQAPGAPLASASKEDGRYVVRIWRAEASIAAVTAADLMALLQRMSGLCARRRCCHCAWTPARCVLQRLTAGLASSASRTLPACRHSVM